jgi:uncharacterized membrane protein YqjE
MPNVPDIPTDPRTGTFAHLSGFLSCIAQYVSARLSLIGIEAKDAGLLYGTAAAMVAGALFVAVLGYIFLVITAVFGIAAAFDAKHAWIVVLGVAAALHLGGAVVLVLLARQRVKGGVFASTLEELKKDQTWLKTLASKR